MGERDDRLILLIFLFIIMALVGFTSADYVSDTELTRDRVVFASGSNNGHFSGSWNDLTDIPSGFADNVDNTSTGGTDWSEITSIPAGFADDIDNDTTYTAGSNLTLTGTEFSINMAGLISFLDLLYETIGGGSGSGFSPTFINVTSTTYTGELVNGSDLGYTAGDSICNAQFSGSHLCTEFEVALWNSPSLNNEDAWIIAGGPKYVPASIPVNDCLGFTHGSAGSYLGNYWHFNSTTKGDPRAINCGSTLKLACCTY